MASKQPGASKKAGGWGSLLSGAVAGLESRLDTILANEEGGEDANLTVNAAGKPTQRPAKSSNNLAIVHAEKEDGTSRDVSRTRANDRLAERLAKVTAAKPSGSSVGSAVPSRTSTPVNDVGAVEHEAEAQETATSVPTLTEPIGEVVQADTTPSEAHVEDDYAKAPLAQENTASLVTARISSDSSRPSTDLRPSMASSRPSAELTNGTNVANLSSKSAGQYEAELHTHMEKIDALQSKLSYLANSTIAAAKAANASPDSTTSEMQMAGKDEQIALLMQEGEKLSKTELRHLQTIKKLRAQRIDDEKIAAEAKKRSDKSEAEIKLKLKRLELAERVASEKNKALGVLEKDVESIRAERAKATESIRDLNAQLRAVKDRAEKAEKEVKEKAANEVDKGRIAALENDIEDAQIEKKLAEDRATAEIKKVREDVESQRQRFDIKELELKNEITGLESRLEALRSRSEEEGVTGTGEGNVQLLRQVETLQRQYALAKDNWEAIEASLNGRLVAVERERDESSRREAEARKRVRDIGNKARKMEEELEVSNEASRRRKEDLDSRREETEALRERLDQSQKAAEDARSEIERQKKIWDVEVQQRVEEERARWLQQSRSMTTLKANSRKLSTADVNTVHSNARRPGTGAQRLPSHDLSVDPVRPNSRRSSGLPLQRQTSTYMTPSPLDSPSLSRQQSSFSLANVGEMPPTPSFDINAVDGFPDHIDEPHHSPDDGNTLADLLSTSTPAAGPSVQLVERMSLLVRRLESEKAGFKDELARLSSQRDSARDEVVALMREVEQKRGDDKKVDDLEDDLLQLRNRHDASLEMLGEREEEVEELKGDMLELKRLYRELVERKVGL